MTQSSKAIVGYRNHQFLSDDLDQEGVESRYRPSKNLTAAEMVRRRGGSLPPKPQMVYEGPHELDETKASYLIEIVLTSSQ